MNWSWKAICYWAMLGAILFVAIYHLLPLLVLAVWAPQYFLNEPEYSIRYFFIGGASLLCFIMCFEDRKAYPLKKQSNRNRFTTETSKVFHPNIINLNTNIHGLPVTHACGAPSSIRFKAIQLIPASDIRESDYEKIFYNFATGEIVEYDKTKPDHRELMEHFLWMINSSGRSSIPKSYLKQYNIIADEPSGEKRNDTLH